MCASMHQVAAIRQNHVVSAVLCRRPLIVHPISAIALQAKQQTGIDRVEVGIIAI